MILVVVVVVILVIAGIAVYAYETSTPPVQVQYINIWAPDNVCGLNTNPIGFGGYNSSTSASEPLELEMPNFNTTSCRISTLTTNTTGFTLSQVEVPLTLPGNATVGLNLTIQSPGSAFNGLLNLVLT